VNFTFQVPPLLIAAREGRVDIMRLLLAHGAAVEATSGVHGAYTAYQVRKTPSWPRSWANCSFF
jgi:ankyrin repeat protein